MDKAFSLPARGTPTKCGAAGNTAAMSLRRLSWTGNTVLLAGAVALSVSPQIAASWQVFVAFAIGHLVWMAVALRRKDNPLLLLNCGLMMLDFYAVSIRMM